MLLLAVRINTSSVAKNIQHASHCAHQQLNAGDMPALQALSLIMTN